MRHVIFLIVAAVVFGSGCASSSVTQKVSEKKMVQDVFQENPDLSLRIASALERWQDDAAKKYVRNDILKQAGNIKSVAQYRKFLVDFSEIHGSYKYDEKIGLITVTRGGMVDMDSSYLDRVNSELIRSEGISGPMSFQLYSFKEYSKEYDHSWNKIFERARMVAAKRLAAAKK